jgi:hypothetical protein
LFAAALLDLLLWRIGPGFCFFPSACAASTAAFRLVATFGITTSRFLFSFFGCLLSSASAFFSSVAVASSSSFFFLTPSFSSFALAEAAALCLFAWILRADSIALSLARFASFCNFFANLSSLACSFASSLRSLFTTAAAFAASFSAFVFLTPFFLGVESDGAGGAGGDDGKFGVGGTVVSCEDDEGDEGGDDASEEGEEAPRTIWLRESFPIWARGFKLKAPFSKSSLNTLIPSSGFVFRKLQVRVLAYTFTPHFPVGSNSSANLSLRSSFDTAPSNSCKHRAKSFNQRFAFVLSTSHCWRNSLGILRW